MSYIIRKGKSEDIESVFMLVKELAEYERAKNEVENTSEQMLEDAFGKRAFFEFFVALDQNQIIGMALYYISYSTWKGKCLYLEDLIVTERYRNKGIGKLLFEQLVKVALKIKAKRIVWQVLTWNKPAIAFYKKINAKFDDEWYTCKLSEKDINNYSL